MKEKETKIISVSLSLKNYGDAYDTTTLLLQKWIEYAPKRSEEIVAILRQAGMEEKTISLETGVKISKPETRPFLIPTFDIVHSYPATPMIMSRFLFAGTIEDNGEKWLSIRDMNSVIKNPKVIKVLRSIIAH